jgi:hypothetical protein
MIVVELVAYLVAPLLAVILQLLAVFDPVGAVVCQRTVTDAGTITNAWTITDTWSITNPRAGTILQEFSGGRTGRRGSHRCADTTARSCSTASRAEVQEVIELSCRGSRAGSWSGTASWSGT